MIIKWHEVQGIHQSNDNAPTSDQDDGSPGLMMMNKWPGLWSGHINTLSLLHRGNQTANAPTTTSVILLLGSAWGLEQSKQERVVLLAVSRFDDRITLVVGCMTFAQFVHLILLIENFCFFMILENEFANDCFTGGCETNSFVTSYEYFSRELEKRDWEIHPAVSYRSCLLMHSVSQNHSRRITLAIQLLAHWCLQFFFDFFHSIIIGVSLFLWGMKETLKQEERCHGRVSNRFQERETLNLKQLLQRKTPSLGKEGSVSNENEEIYLQQ